MILHDLRSDNDISWSDLRWCENHQKKFTIQSGDFWTAKGYSGGGYAALATRYHHFSRG